jgi:protein-tyrosine kinase
MSRYFNQSRQTLERAASVGEGNKPELVRILQEVTNAVAVPAETLDARLGRCRKVRLGAYTGKRLMSSHPNFPAAIIESYRALRIRMLKLQAAQKLRSFIITSAVGGEGKTLTTMNLALCCSQLPDLRILVIDADLRTRGLTCLFDNPPGPGLSDILAGQSEYQEALLSTDYSNLFVIGAGGSSTPAPELYSGRQWKDLIDWASQVFPLILVDSPPVLPVADFEQIVHACDGVLAVVRARQTSRELLKEMAGRMDSKKLVGVIFNGASSDHSREYGSGYSSGF